MAFAYPIESFETARPDDVGRARARVERLHAGLSRALLASTPEFLAGVAQRALDATSVAARRSALLGDRPALDGAAVAEIDACVGDFRLAVQQLARARRDRHRLIACGNTVGVAALASAAVMLASGVDLMALPVAAAVFGAAGGPLSAAFLAANESSAAVREVDRRRARWAAALDRAGLVSMGQLAATRLAVAGWERRAQEAEIAEASAKSHVRAWQRLAGPGVAPSEAAAVIDRLSELRAAQLELLRLLLEQALHSSSGNRLGDQVRAPIALPPVPAPVAILETARAAAEDAPQSRLDDILHRIRGRKLRLFNG